MTASDELQRPKRRRSETVERLLDAALETFAEVGFAAASVEDICRRGGFTRGAFYSSFRTKDELFEALFVRETARNFAHAEEQLAGLEGETDPVAAAVERCLGTFRADRTWVLVHTEYALHATRHPEAAAALRRHAELVHHQLTELIRTASERLGIHAHRSGAPSGPHRARPARRRRHPRGPRRPRPDRQRRRTRCLRPRTHRPAAAPALGHHRAAHDRPIRSPPHMSTFLARLGRASFRHRGVVSVAWLAILGAVVALLVTVGGSFDDRFTIPGSESQEALDRLAELSPGASGAGAQIVFVAPDGAVVTDPAYASAIQQAVAAATKSPQVAAVVSPFDSQAVSPDGRAALATVQFDVQREELESGSVDALQAATTVARDAGLEVAVGGNAFGSTGVTIGATEFIGVIVAVLVLVLTFGSLLAAGMNLLTALIGIGVGMGGLLLVSHLVTLSSTAPTLALMIGLAVGIDYALFILSRHRSQLAGGMDPEESAARATGTAGSAVVFAGLTVVIALSGLAVVGIPFLTVMGVGAAGTVLVAVLVALTLLPAMMGLAGGRLAPQAGLPRGPPRARGRRTDDGCRRLDGRPVDPADHPAPAAHRARRAGRRRRPGHSGAAAAAGPAGQLDRRAGHPPAPGLRPHLGELRPRPERPARRPRPEPGPGDGPADRRRDRRRHRWHADRHARPVLRRDGPTSPTPRPRCCRTARPA